MKLETKFSVGQTVYLAETGAKLTIKQIDSTVTEHGCESLYSGITQDTAVRFYKEVELTSDKPKPKSIYDLQEGDNYYLLDNLGCVQSYIFDGCAFDEKVIYLGNVFLTAEEAEKEAKRREIHQELKRLANGYRFKHLACNWRVRYDHNSGSLYVNFQNSLMDGNTVYFGTKDEVLKAIGTIGEERLKKDYFGIEEKA